MATRRLFLVRWCAVCWIPVVSLARAEVWQSDFDLSSAQFQNRYDELVPKGFRPATFTVHDPGGGAVFQIAWVNDGFNNWASAYGMTDGQYQTFSDAQSVLGRRPICVSAYGTFPNELYAAVWINDGVTSWQARRRMTSSTYVTESSAMTTAGYRPYWVSVTGSGADTRYAALWIADGKGRCSELNLNNATFASRLLSYHMGGCRVISSSGHNTAANPLFTAVWVSWEHPDWDYRHDQTLAQLQTNDADFLAQGFRPSFFTAYETTAGRRYTSAWERIPVPPVWTVTGPDVPSLAAFDNAIQQYMVSRHFPNGALAMTKNGRLVLARGYTYAPPGWPLTRPTSPFRVQSMAKTLTAVGIMKLVEEGVITIDQPVSTIIDTSSWIDPRINNVTVRYLLQHWGGFDINARGYDPMYYDFQISAALGRPLPTTPQMIVDFMATKPLDYDPGSQAVYSIFGYCLLGRILETATGQSYESWMRQNIFAPVQAYGITTADSLLGDQQPEEPPYIDPYRRISQCVMGPGTPPFTPITYGGYNIRTLQSTAGLVGSAIDYVKVLCAFDDIENSPLLSEPTIELMWSRPPGDTSQSSNFYACGWLVSTFSVNRRYTSHTGASAGSNTLFLHRDDGVNWVALFNSNQAPGTPPAYDISPTLSSLVDVTVNWPAHDYFPFFDQGDLNCDSHLTLSDIPAFVLALLDADTYALTYPDCHIARADADGNGLVNGLDIGPFVQRLAALN